MESAGLLSSHDEEEQLYEPKVDPEQNRLQQAVHSVKTYVATFPSLIKPNDTIRLYGDKALAVFLFLLPSFISSRVQRNKGEISREPIRTTAFLDGLRGLAAVAVFNGHLISTLDNNYTKPWGFKGKFNDICDLWRLPGARIVWNGSFSVALFFVISGFALSISPIAAMRKRPRDPAAAMAKLSSAIFRRPFRLFIPALASTVLVFILVRCGYWVVLKEHQQQFAKLIHGPDPFKRRPSQKSSFMAQVQDLLKNDRHMFTVFTAFGERMGNVYNGPLWTIGLEFRASIVLYLTHAAAYFMSRPVRTAVLICLVVFGTSIHALDFPLFWAGFLIAEYSPNLPPEPSSSSSSSSSSWFASSPLAGEDDIKRADLRKRSITIISKVIPWFLFFVGIYLGTYPRAGPKFTPLYAPLRDMVPFSYPSRNRFWFGVGAIAIVTAIDRVSVLARFYSLPPIQYLGKISFSFYLCHVCIAKGVAQFFFWLGWSISGQSNCFAQVLGFLIGWTMSMALLIWVADIFWRCVDVPSVKLAASFEKWLLSF